MQTITVDQLKQWKQKNKDFLFLNVLSHERFTHEHALGSRNLPFNAKQDDGKPFADQVEKLAESKDRDIVVYCAGPQCDASTKAAKHLDQAGFTNVYDFEGGMQAWKQANMPVSVGQVA